MIAGITEGITTYAAAIRHVSRFGLWGYVLLPGLLSLLLALGILSMAWGLSDNLAGLILGWWSWDWGRSVVEIIAQVLGGLLIIAVGAVLFKQLIMVVLAPVMSILSAKVEAQITGKQPDDSFSVGRVFSEMVRGLRVALRNIVRELSATFFLLLLGLIPVLTPFTTLLIFLIQSYYAGFGNADYTLERHYSYRDSVRFVQQHRGLSIGNGIVFMLLFLSVVGFLFALPLGTVAATLQTLKRIDHVPGGV